MQVSPTLSTGIYQVRDNTVGVAPLFALTYVRLLKAFDAKAEQDTTTSPSRHTLLEKLAEFFRSGHTRLFQGFMPSKNMLSDAEARTLSTLGVTFFFLLVTIGIRLYGRRGRH